MNNSGGNFGFMLYCDLEGRIEEVVRDDIGISRYLTKGRQVSSLICREDFTRFLDFLARIRTQGMAIEFPLTAMTPEGTEPLMLAGAECRGRYVLLAGKDKNRLLEYSDELSRMVAEQGGRLRELIRNRISAKQNSEGDYFDKLTAVNNELVNLQRELSRKNAVLARLNEEKTRFLGMAAHDLRNPLMAIQMFSDFLMEDLSSYLSPDHLDFLKTIRTSSDFMRQIVEDFLTVSKIESGYLALNRLKIDLAGLIGDAVRLNAKLAARHSVDIRFETALSKLEIIVDDAKITQVMNNLLTNAVKFSPEAGTVLVSLSKDAKTARITVTDSGPGIPAEDHEKIFRPFEQSTVKDNRGEKGSGLGLAISQKIINAHGGGIHVKSSPGQGSSFEVCLPLSRENS